MIYERKIALSLPYTYLAGQEASPRDSILRRFFGIPAVFLPELSGLLSGIEISHFKAEAPPEEIEAAIRTIWNHGLEALIHPYLPAELPDTCIADVYPWINAVLSKGLIHQNRLVLNLHALVSKSLSENQLMRKTVENLKSLKTVAENEKFPIAIAVEINRKKGKKDPGTNYQNLIDICRQVDSPTVGIGWDIGHTYSNVLHGHVPQNTPTEFVRRVIHVHVHDIGPNNETHWPLSMGRLPLDSYIQELQAINYEGYYVLELYPERFIEKIPANRAFFESIERLRRGKE